MVKAMNGYKEAIPYSRFSSKLQEKRDSIRRQAKPSSGHALATIFNRPNDGHFLDSGLSGYKAVISTTRRSIQEWGMDWTLAVDLSFSGSNWSLTDDVVPHDPTPN